MNTIQLFNRAVEILADKERGLMLDKYGKTRARTTRSRIKESPTHLRHIAMGLGRTSPAEVMAFELTDENYQLVKRQLKVAGKGEKVIGNTMSTFVYLRDLAIEEGVPVAVVPKPEKVKKGRVYMKDLDGNYRKTARAEFVSNNSPYGLRFRDWPPGLKAQWEKYKRFHTDRFAEDSAVNMLRESTLKMRLNLFERMFGIEVMRGVPIENLSFRGLAHIDVVIAQHRFLNERNNGKDTMGMKAHLDLIRSLALEDFGDKAMADRISLYLRKIDFEPTKDKNDMVERIHPDHLHFVGRCLIAHAMHYEADRNRRHGRKYPDALMAYYWHCAAIWIFTITTLLRQSNVAGAKLGNIIRRDDGSWHYSFPSGKMKGDRPKADSVVDLWRGSESEPLIRFVMDKAVETRPFLVERFRAENPGKPDPDTFFLNIDGRPHSTSGMRNFFTDTAVAYLGPEKRFSQHDVRTIVASWVLVREGHAILNTLANHLHHKTSAVTLKYYVRIENIFGARLAIKQMEERQKQQEALANLHKLPDELRSALYHHRSELNARLDRLESAVDSAALKALGSQMSMLIALLPNSPVAAE